MFKPVLPASAAGLVLMAGLVSLSPAAAETGGADPSRQAEVAERGARVMPFALDQTRHVFTKTPDGGVQRVVALPGHAAQAEPIRAHLREIAGRFARGDFSGPAYIHGENMPGLAELRAARPAEWTVDYREVEGGAEIVYASAQPRLVQALHAWFDAQLADHGHHAQHGHGEPGMQ